MVLVILWIQNYVTISLHGDLLFWIIENCSNGTCLGYEYHLYLRSFQRIEFIQFVLLLFQYIRYIEFDITWQKKKKKNQLKNVEITISVKMTEILPSCTHNFYST